MVPETLYVVRSTYTNRRGRTFWTVIENNAKMFADTQEEDVDVTSFTVYEMNLPDLIDGALDDILNGEYPATDLIVLREYSV